jgi:hypothetical protein
MCPSSGNILLWHARSNESLFSRSVSCAPLQG